MNIQKRDHFSGPCSSASSQVTKMVTDFKKGTITQVKQRGGGQTFRNERHVNL